MRSRTGCLTCRQRKLKCSEEKPACAQCVKALRECIPSSGITFRHQHNASLNGGVAEAGEQAPLGKYYSYKNTFDDESVWLEIPKQVTFIHTSNPYEDPPTPGPDHLVPTPPQSSSSQETQGRTNWTAAPMSSDSDGASNTHMLDAGGTGMDIARLETDSPHIQGINRIQNHRGSDGLLPASVHSPTSIQSGAQDIGFSPQSQLLNSNLDFILNHPSSASPPIDPTLQYGRSSTRNHALRKQSYKSSASAMSGFKQPETSQEIAYLLRYFSEGPGLWMDLFDLGLYFSYYVPVKALIHPLLKYSAVALAAKALGRIRGNKPTYGGKKSRLARSERYPGAQKIDWDTKGREYYDTAIGILRQRLLDDSSIMAVENDGSEMDDGADPSVQKRRRLNDMAISCPHSVELLVATAILGVYEFIDASNPDWSRHLNGAKSLLEIAKDGMMPFEHASNVRSGVNQSPLLKARKATFWNIARQDMLAAFINDTHTRLNTEDLDLWREAGLLVDESGFILPSNDDAITGMREDLVSNALVWLMMKLVNFLAAGDDLPAEIGGPWAGVPQASLLEYWYHLQSQFQRWFDILPKTFNPCARIEAQHPVPASNTSPTVPDLDGFNMGDALDEDEDDLAAFPEIWFAIPMCAATMQHYHFAQVLLLMNKPHESTQGRTTLCARMVSYHALLSQSLHHSREIVSIALARPEASSRVHAVQPLYAAGQCLKEERERRVVVGLLREIEEDTGWATGYRVEQLLRQWAEEGG